MKRYTSILFLILIAFISSCDKSSSSDPEGEPDGNAPVAEHKIEPYGVNLAGAEFGDVFPGKFGEHYTYPNAEELDYFKNKGLRLIRLPFRWERIQPTLNESLDAAELSRMKSFVSAAEERGILVLLDMHNYARRSFKGTSYVIGGSSLTTEHVTDVWSKIAEEFKSYNNIWGYGLMNEPHDMPGSSTWFNIAQALIDKIRVVDTKTTIVVGGDSFSSAARWLLASDNLKNLKDPSDNLIFEAHIYFDNDHSGKYAKGYDAEACTPTTGVERAKPFVEWLNANGLRGFIGEYGVPDNDPRWLETLDNMLKYLKDNCVNGTYWAAGPWWPTYAMSVEPKDGIDRPQLSTLLKYQQTDPELCK